ncbi:protein-disulfide reductase DsbD [Acidipila sp. EB88]|uniref:protein-disulfide reductase DsbD family protein n=1 Tax=Acidipila sp. EB88 TaxID=2305226 RepID=UPI000F5FD676|nr:protein-disulfide reductase DsbD domain-containing protein [Acidipila sp. EB88]RRA49423.1 disulfide bond formation protein DsbD [Acidipila sp. EB88]
MAQESSGCDGIDFGTESRLRQAAAKVRGLWLLSLLACLLALCAGTVLQAQGARVDAQHLSVELVVPEQQLVRSASLTAGLHFELEKGWHVYWLNAGDSGEPPRVRWTLPKGVAAAAFQYPAPQRLPLGPLMDYGYEHDVVFPVPIKVAADAALGAATLRADVDWLVCREVCLPGKATLSLATTIAAAGTTAGVDAGHKAIVDRGVASLPKPLPAGAAHFAASAKGFTLAVETGQQANTAQFFPTDQTVIAAAAPEQAAPVAKGVRLELVKDENQQGKLSTLNGVLVLPGGASYTVAATPGVIPAAVLAQGHADSGFFQALLLGFGGGIILNLMPCVFPVLFIKGLSLVQSSREERSTLRAHGWVYTLGILVSFWIVVAVLLVARGLGHNLGWGFQFQSPVFLALMGLFLFFLSLSLAGQFEIGLSMTSAGGELAKKQGYAGSFFTGVLAMVVATPCTAPLMGVAIGYALAHGGAGVVTFAVFTALGLGLATPYLLLVYNPGWTRLLPRPGAWMDVLKQLTAIPILATVIWLIWLFTQAAGVNALLGLLGGFLLLAVAGAVLGRWPAQRGATLSAIVIVALAAALPVYAVQQFGAPLGAAASTAKGAGNDWKPFTPEALAMYRAEGKPVLVDFTASWCLSCQVNERVVLDRADVQDRLRRSGVVLLKADWTRHDASIGEALATLGRSGIPTYALYPASATAPPQMLPEVLTTGVVYAALDELHAGTAPAGQ